MTIDEANGRILDHESRYNCALVAVTTIHASLDGGDSNIFEGRDKGLADEDASEVQRGFVCVGLCAPPVKSRVGSLGRACHAIVDSVWNPFRIFVRLPVSCLGPRGPILRAECV